MPGGGGGGFMKQLSHSWQMAAVCQMLAVCWPQLNPHGLGRVSHVAHCQDLTPSKWLSQHTNWLAGWWVAPLTSVEG